jgi:mono/diheme cytochrome c family protein
LIWLNIRTATPPNNSTCQRQATTPLHGFKEAAMNLQFVCSILVSALTTGLFTTVGAQQNSGAPEKLDPGKYEYDSSCAVCHGLTGKGDGPFAKFMEKSQVADIATLSKRNSGVFPFARVYDTIDGTNLIGAHGNRDMPIWGTRYKSEAIKQEIYDISPHDPEVFARARILALTEYIYQLQAK